VHLCMCVAGVSLCAPASVSFFWCARLRSGAFPASGAQALHSLATAASAVLSACCRLLSLFFCFPEPIPVLVDVILGCNPSISYLS
jgi:hypothetical protein